MARSKRKLKPSNHCVSVWLARRPLTKREAFAYTADDEQQFRFPKADVDEVARSKFAADFSLTYDDSFMEEEFKRSPTAIRSLVRGLEFCSRIPDEIAAAAKKRRITKSNYIVALPYFMYDSKDYAQPYASRLHEYSNRRSPLSFVGCFVTKEAKANAESVSIPMSKKRILLLKHDPIAANFKVHAVQRDKASLTIYSGISSRRLRKETKDFESPKDANSAMASMVDEKLKENYRVEDRGWKTWVT